MRRLHLTRGRVAGLALAMAAVVPVLTPAATGPRLQLHRVLRLGPNEGVYAYSRIAPSGRFLVYASQQPSPDGRSLPQPAIRVVDLFTHTTAFTEPGVDGYWSESGDRLIFLSRTATAPSVSIWHSATGAVTRDVAASDLGDYYSWGRRDGRDIIMTIESNYYYLDGDRGGPVKRVKACPGIGVGARPLISKDGLRVTTFVNGRIWVRNVDDCDAIVDTGVEGGKADFSWDGRYLAFHIASATLDGYDIAVVDLQRRTIRRLEGLQGSALFPSWTKDGRLCFRYDAADYRGFVVADNILTLPETPLSAAPIPETWPSLTALDLDSGPTPTELTLLLVWSTWSAHSAAALMALQQSVDEMRSSLGSVRVMTAVDQQRERVDAARLLQQSGITIPFVPIRTAGLHHTGALNQMPCLLAFSGRDFVGSMLGAHSADEIRTWVSQLTRLPEPGVPHALK
jgi:hypothetical protein